MKRIKFVSLILLSSSMPVLSTAINTATFSSTTPSLSHSATPLKSLQSSTRDPDFNVADLLGYWHCRHQMFDPSTKIKVDIDYKINFFSGGKSTGTGHLLLMLDSMPGFKYKINDSSTWSLKGDVLTMTSEQMEFNNISHPQFDELLNLQTLFPKKVNEASTILVLNESTLKVDAKSSLEDINCSR